MKLKILIADDESVDRSGIAFVIKRIDADAEIFEAANGVEALSIFEQNDIDLIITDIRMPGMSGIEFVEQAQKKKPWVKAAVVSAFGEFDYAKEIMKMGINHYILKPVNPEECQTAIRSLIGDIMQEKEDMWRKKALDIIKGDTPDMREWPYGLNIMLFDYDEPVFDRQKNCTDSLPFKSPFTVIVNEYQLLLFLNESYHAGAEMARDYLDAWKKENSHICLIVVLGGVLQEIGVLCQVFDKIEQFLGNKFYNKEPAVYSLYETAQRQMYKDDFLTRIQIIGKMIKDKNPALRAEFDQLFKDMRSAGNLSAIFVKYICSEFIKDVLLQKDGRADAVFEPYLKRVHQAQDFDVIKSICEELIEEKSRPFDGEDDYNTRAVEMVIEYIRANYQKEINLEIVSDKVFLSASYLCQIFKKVTGESFIKYLTNYRMEKARHLVVTTGLKINEICELIGYKDASYFCSIFKTYYGATPAQYRRMY